MSTPKPYPIFLRLNETFQIIAIWKDANGDPVDLTGGHAELVLKTERGGEIKLQKTEADATLTIDGANGKVTGVITPADTYELTTETASQPTRGTYVLEAETSAGERKRLVEGSWTCAPR